jgi:hypothetical protein
MFGDMEDDGSRLEQGKRAFLIGERSKAVMVGIMGSLALIVIRRYRWATVRR